MIGPTTGFLLYVLGCPLIPAGSTVHAVSCEASPTRVFTSFEACYDAKEAAKRARDMDVFAVCIERSGLSANDSPEWD
jgi:hypothetical protein